jgi:hypothetical protein
MAMNKVQTRVLYDAGMITASGEFTVTEAAMTAVLETMNTMNHAITELSRQVEAQSEAIVVLDARLALVEHG